MKNEILNKISFIVEVGVFICCLTIICLFLSSCDKEERIDTPSLNICESEIYTEDFYDDGFDWDALEEEINLTCKQHYKGIEE